MVFTPCRVRGVPLIQFLISVLYILLACLYRMLLHLSFFPSRFPYLSPPYLSFPSRIDPLCFQAGCRKRRLNLALVFLCLFCSVIRFFWLVNVCFGCIRFSFFHTKPRDWLGETSLKLPILCRVGRETTTQSILVVRPSVCADAFSSWLLVRFVFHVLCVEGAFSALTLLVGRQEGHPACKKTEWWDAGVVSVWS